MGPPTEALRLTENPGGSRARQAALLRLSAEIAAAADEDQVCEAIVQGLRIPHEGEQLDLGAPA